MSDTSLTIPMENRHISSSLMEKILTVKNNSLVGQFFAVYKIEATGKGIKNVTVNNAGEMTFLPKGKESIINTEVYPNVWQKPNRQAGSFGKVLRKLLVENDIDGKSIINRELEEIVNALKAYYTVEGEFTIVSGSDIKFYYLEDNYDYNNDFNLGSMDSSCMRHSGACQEACEFFVDNENCELVILKHPDKPLSRARALLWTDVDGKKWMDRIYGADHIIAAFKQFAHSNGWAHKASQDSCEGDWVFPNGSHESRSVFIKAPGSYEIYPYMDTMVYVGGSQMSNSDTIGYEYYAQTEPDEQADNEWDEYNDCYVSSEDSIYLDYVGYTTHVQNTFYCPLTEQHILDDDGVTLDDGRRVWNEADEIIYISSESDYFHIDDVSYCSFNDEHYPSDDVEWVGDLGIDVLSSSVNEAYEAAGWIQDEDDNWVDGQHQMNF